MKIFILTHTDLDGYFSGAIAKMAMQEQYPDAEIVVRKWTYGQKLITTKHLLKTYDKVIVCDLMPDTKFMTELAQKGPDYLTWIDHHIKPDSEFRAVCSELDIPLNGITLTEDDPKESAAMICWKFYRGTSGPMWLELLSDYDSWNRAGDVKYWKNLVMPFFHFLTVRVTSVEDAISFIEHTEKEGPFDEVYNVYDDIETGQYFAEAVEAEYRKEVTHGFKKTVECIMSGERRKLVAYFLNTQLRGSSIFNDLPNKEDYDVFIPYSYNGEKYSYSMYTFKEDIRCNETTLLYKSNYGRTESGLEFKGHRDAAGSNSLFFNFEVGE